MTKIAHKIKDVKLVEEHELSSVLEKLWRFTVI